MSVLALNEVINSRYSDVVSIVQSEGNQTREYVVRARRRSIPALSVDIRY
jgi:hypothetical protein